MAREQDLGRLYAETLGIPAGATAVFTTVPGMYGFAVEYISGGSLSIGGPSFNIMGTSLSPGSTYQVGGYGATTGTIFTLANTNVFMINDFVGTFHLIATGATTICSLVRTFTNGN